MHVLTAGTGDQPGDFAHTTPGELVIPSPMCDRDRQLSADDPGGCGCRHAFIGLTTRRATTVAVVADLPMTRHDLGLRIAESDQAAGILTTATTRKQYHRHAAHLADFAEQHAVGATVRRLGDTLTADEHAAA